MEFAGFYQNYPVLLPSISQEKRTGAVGLDDKRIVRECLHHLSFLVEFKPIKRVNDLP